MSRKNPWVVAFCAWLLPGLGHALLGERRKGTLLGALIIVAFAGGVVLGSFRDVFIGPGRYAIVAQLPAGILPVLMLLGAHLKGLHAVPTDVPMRIYDIGTLYTSVAGLLNALLVFDAGIKAHERSKGTKVQR